MAEEKFISKFDGTTENKLLDIINQNQEVFPFDSELNEQSQHGLTNAAIAKEINAIKDATSNNKGYFLTEEALKNAYPVANNGSKAYVGENYPYNIYIYASGVWVDSGQTGGDDSFNAGEFYTKTQIDQKHEVINNEIARVEKGANYEVLEYEVNIATTRLKVSEENRKGGYMITYNSGSGWIKEQYIGELTTNEEWIKDENWKAEILNDSIQAIAEYAQQQANLAATNAVLAEEKANEAATQAAYAKEQGDNLKNEGFVKSTNLPTAMKENLQELSDFLQFNVTGDVAGVANIDKVVSVLNILKAEKTNSAIDCNTAKWGIYEFYNGATNAPVEGIRVGVLASFEHIQFLIKVSTPDILYIRYKFSSWAPWRSVSLQSI